MHLKEEKMTDYELFLQEFGVTEEYMRRISRDMSDHIPFSADCGIESRPSLIEGNGMFAVKDIPAWRMICPMRINGKRTMAGRGVNHAREPNSIVISVDTNLFLVACRHIDANEELTANYRQTVQANVNSRGFINPNGKPNGFDHNSGIV